MPPSASTVAACIIGNEILNGKTLDTNSHYLAKGCFSHGLDLQHIRVIPDDESVIVQAIRELSRDYSLVVSSGGIGPTHDDITYEAIAQAMERPLICHEPTLQRMGELAFPKVGQTPNEGQRRMVTIPRPDQVIVTPNLWVPLVKVANILILPGIPELFQKMLDHWLETELPNDSSLVCQRMIRRLVRTHWWESQVAAPLRAIQNEVASEGIQIGSYPKMSDQNSQSHVVLSIVGSASMKQRIDQLVHKLETDFEGEEVTL